MYLAQLTSYNLEGHRVVFTAKGETMREADNNIVREVLAYCDEHAHDVREIMDDGEWTMEELS